MGAPGIINNLATLKKFRGPPETYFHYSFFIWSQELT